MKHRFRAIVGRETFPFFKPDPRVLAETIRACGGTKERTIMIGDSITDLETARNLGADHRVSFGYTNVPMAELGPDRLIHHFDALDEAWRAFSPDHSPQARLTTARPASAATALIARGAPAAAGVRPAKSASALASAKR